MSYVFLLLLFVGNGAGEFKVSKVVDTFNTEHECREAIKQYTITNPEAQLQCIQTRKEEKSERIR